MMDEKETVERLPVLVTGSGDLALKCSMAISDRGFRVILFTQKAMQVSSEDFKDRGIEIFDDSNLKRFEGYPTRFQAVFTKDNIDHQRQVGAVLLANEVEYTDNTLNWGVTGSSKVKTISWLESCISDAGPHGLNIKPGSKVAILSGIKTQSHPSIQKRSIQHAIALKEEYGCRVFFFTDNLRVAGRGAERFMGDARHSGVIFIKTGEDGYPEISGNHDGIKIKYLDDAMNQLVSFECDLLLVEDGIRPSSEIKHLSEIMGLRLDSRGFFQCENIRNRPIGTNRDGIWAVGTAKGDLSDSASDDIKAVLLELDHLLRDMEQKLSAESILLDSKRCTICLTCYRLCPHRAISIVNRRPVFHSISCRRCGICISECPMEALSFSDETDNQVRGEIARAIEEVKGNTGDSTPIVVAICCQNSAFEALRLSRFLGCELPEGLCAVKVPCAGRIGVNLVLHAINSGAHGVMVLGCHDGSCKSFYGSLLSEWKLETLDEFLGSVGIDKDRVFFGTLSPSMGMEFYKLSQDMINRLKRDSG